MENHEANQAAFTKVVRHLLKQGKRSVAVGGGCVYRGRGGLMCAVGCLIPEAEYSESLEGGGVREIYDSVPALQGLDKRLLAYLQNSHDNYPVSDWPSRLAEVAREFGLTMPEVAP